MVPNQRTRSYLLLYPIYTLQLGHEEARQGNLIYQYAPLETSFFRARVHHKRALTPQNNQCQEAVKDVMNEGACKVLFFLQISLNSDVL